MADTINDNTESQTIRTLAFEYAKAPNYQCLVCKKSILSRSLCIATIERTSKKQKKKLVKPTDTTHFKCWTGKNKRKNITCLNPPFWFFFSSSSA